VPDTEQHSVQDLLYTLVQARWLIAFTTIAAVLLAIAYAALATPIYRSDVVVQVEETNKTIAGLAEPVTERPPSEAQMEILRSRSLIGAVVDQLKLDIVATPRRFPVIGRAIARHHSGPDPAPAPARLGLAAYGWGGERIRVERLDVPPALLNKPFTLVAGDGGSYELRDAEGRHVATGQVGKAAQGTIGGNRVELYVSDLVARPGTEFTLVRRNHLRVIEQLQGELGITERGRHTGVLVVALDDPDPLRAAATLDGIASTYVRQNVERKSEVAAKTLEFLQSQLPQLKANVDASEAALQSYQVKAGSVDLSREAQTMLARSVEIEKAISEAELQRADLGQRFTGNHPALLSLREKIDKLRAERANINARMKSLPGTELDSARLARDVKVSSELYNLLLNKSQQLKVERSGTIGNVRLLDRASVPDRPVRPVTSLVLFISVVLGLGGGVALAFTRKSLYSGLDDAEAVEQFTGVAVYATIPRSARESTLNRATRRRGAQALLAALDPSDPAIEAIRSLRTGLQFALLEAPNNVIMVTGPTVDVGKSFVTVNLACVLAAAGRRVLVIDGDLRRGRVHRLFRAGRTPGLSDVLAGSVTVADAIQASRIDGLHWLATGRLPPNPSELLASERFKRVVADLSSRYDLLLIDTAPILPVTDAAITGQLAGTTLLVLRAGAHPAREIVASVKRLAQNGVTVQGAVFNDVSGEGARYSKYGYQYRYDSRA
jgi:tyrosine-protein kinase Etk/Wzc